ncbi:DUF58 domain-containing protein [bacterium]|nr:DUF58 domain-containing protein [bacterium]
MEQKIKLLDPKVLAKLSNLYLVARTAVEGLITGLHKGLYKGFSVEFYEHREYVPGDDLKYLDWKVFGRTDRLYLKTFREETNLRSYILLDISNSMNFSSLSITKLRYGIFLAASLSYLMVNQQDAVGLVTFDKEVRDFLKCSSTSTHLHSLLNILEGIKGGGETSIGEVIEKIVPSIKKRSLIILISDLLDNPENVIKGLSHFRHKHHEVIVFQILDPAEVYFPYEGSCEFFDLETNEKIAVDVPYVMETYRRIFREFLEGYRKSFSERNIDYQVALTDKPFDNFLYNYLNVRSKFK